MRAVRRADKGHQVAFAEATSRDAVDRIRNRDVLVSERRPLGEGEFWPDQLVGLEVRPGGGRVTGVVCGPAQDRLAIERGDVVFEIPFVEALVPVVDVEGGYLEVVEIDGLSESTT